MLGIATLITATVYLGSPGLLSFQIATISCPMAHCNSQMSDQEPGIKPPLGSTVTAVYHDPQPDAGSGSGLGCSSNGTVVACSNQNKTGDNIVVYASTGARLWTSGTLLDGNAFASAPIVNATGGVIAADDKSIVSFDPNGNVLWNTPTPGGIPISPIQTASGTIFLATKGGPVSAYDPVTGALLGSILIQQTPGSSQYFDTVNTPCALNNRVYVSTEQTDDPLDTGWLVAIDVDATNTVTPLSVAWHFTFGGPSGASPLCYGNAIYFDGHSLNPGGANAPQAFGVQDNGTTGTLMWSYAESARIVASFAQDPRGNTFWLYPAQVGTLERHQMSTGALIDTINVQQLLGSGSQNYPLSAMSITRLSSQPVMILGTTNLSQTYSFVTAINLATHALFWKVPIAPAYGKDQCNGQFPLIQNSVGQTFVVAEGEHSGAYFFGIPAQSK